MRIKICGITKPDQGKAIAQMGATALGFMCVPQSPRYISPEQIRLIVDHLPVHPLTGALIDRVGVFANATLVEICQVVAIANLNAVQLHGSESPEFCQQLRAALPEIEILKALRVRSSETLAEANAYTDSIDALLLDAYHPKLLGGTGKTLDWSSLQNFRPNCSWLLAGGLTPSNVREALNQVFPDGIDLSSGVEHLPGDKDLAKVAQLFEQLKLHHVAKLQSLASSP
ncbi:phosphoribosylanthranilate isomerase [Leptolyngbya sp. FACHB-671]|uniref:phosphoribosylanthranilate isomerase n=1 Tax=Leptolyngbya sp. FACHB-671 TaxID=2692812 RepID=UPI0016841B38|nr:phosphoribosylanthranilate isomerase [Leptolyngbya sp. FACHB-671]MBD1866272.1 phosphoribosylanthranilate isomerase [Cyanobacteria bacterium FACHB-471]MBD2071492.1 phosphoribosylanthranilate isomerase [Leptolyngbya sp. FACHB-671]